MSSVLVTSDPSRSPHTEFFETEHTSLSWKSAHSIEGIVTELDTLYRVIAKKDPTKVTLGDIMSSPIIAVDEQLSLKDAISLKRSKHIRNSMIYINIFRQSISELMSKPSCTEYCIRCTAVQ